MGQSCSRNSSPTIKPDGGKGHDSEKTAMEFRSTMTMITMSSNRSNMRYSFTADFPIFDGSSIPPESPWGAFISEGIDDDYSESEDAEILDAVKQLKCVRDLQTQTRDSSFERRRPSLEEEVAKRHSISSLGSDNDDNEADYPKRRRSRRMSSRNSLCSSSSSLTNEEDFIPAKRRFS